jgi:hypothetical protein
MNNRQRKNNPNTSKRRNQKFPHHSHNGSSPDDLLPKYHYPERLPESCKVSPMCFRVRRENLEKLFGGNGGPGRKNRKQSKSAGPKFSGKDDDFFLTTKGLALVYSTLYNLVE